MPKRPPKHTVICPHCGGEIPANASACRHCGSDERTGWSPDTYLDGLDLPDEDEYEEIAAREFGGGRPARRRRLSWVAIVAGLLVALAAVGLIVQFL